MELMVTMTKESNRNVLHHFVAGPLIVHRSFDMLILTVSASLHIAYLFVSIFSFAKKAKPFLITSIVQIKLFSAMYVYRIRMYE